ncbi:hypothetical protein [Sediminicurvatus halobius]|uniref:Uncharacterized protein n=1 Tax=Sediminicurvatus halobius TaxID=2182432 RepID=A0A2U2MVW4_9GAMM|nr:hypothetical protein [Spiribacter halobius]PWG60926.1 hypothetical protein DEM34_19105 [Spiribacter halobius]UEX79712.1 hypothetical protein LMH63_08725 [Spiribacter halobius]
MDRSFPRIIPETAPLARVFWLYGVIPSNVLWIVLLAMLWAGSSAALIAALGAVLLVYTGWIVVAVWAAADNVQKELYGVLARWLTVAWALNTVLFLGFLLVDLGA